MNKTGVVLVCFHTPEETLSCAMMYAAMNCINHIVIVDNETTEESRTVFKSIKHEKIEVLYQNKNWGYSKGNNIGIDFLIGQYGIENIIISNSDVEINEKSVSVCIEELNNNAELGAIAPLMKAPDGKNYPLRFIELGYLRIFLRILFPEMKIDGFTQKYCVSQNNIVYQSFLPGSFFVLKCDAIEKCNGFDERIFLYREEEILGKKMKLLGYQIAVCTDCFFVHNHSYKEETAELKTNRNKIVMRSERVYFQEYMKSNKFQMIYVNIMQNIYLFTRNLGWRFKDMLKK